jgi:hypothetical protein
MDGVQFHAAPFAGFEAIGVARRVSKERRHFASCPLNDERHGAAWASGARRGD